LLGHGPTYGLPLRRLGRGPTPPERRYYLFGFWYERASVNRESGLRPLLEDVELNVYKISAECQVASYGAFASRLIRMRLIAM